MKSIYRLAMLLILVSLLTVSLPAQVLAQSNSTTIGTLSLVPTYETISVYSNFTGDDNENNQAVLEYREVGSAVWQPGIPMTPDRREMLSKCDYSNGSTYYEVNPWKDQWRAVIFFLPPDTQYEVRVTYTDPDGGSGAVTGTITTLDDNPPSNGTTYYVSTTGSDSNNGLTTNTAFATIQHAADIVQPGDTVSIMPGTYPDYFLNRYNYNVFVSTSGTEDNWITFQSYDMNNKAEINGQGAVAGNFDLDSVSHIRLRGLRLTNPGTSNGKNIILDRSNNIIVEDCEMVFSTRGWCGAGMIIRYGQNPPHVSCYNVLFQRNQIRSDDSRAEDFGIYSWGYENYAIVIRENEMIGNGMKDSISGHWYKDTFIHDNYFQGAWGDGMELEGEGLNIAAWGNTIMDGWPNDVSFPWMGIGMAPVIVGPYYLFRNVWYGFRDSGLKLGNSSQGVTYLYHNTVYTYKGAGAIGCFGNNGLVNNVIGRNNIFEVDRQIINNGQPERDWGIFDMDYNNFYIPNNQWGKWWGYERYDTYEEFKAGTGWEQNGMSAPSELVDPENKDFTLQATSPCIDQGVVIPGFNDANSPWPYSGSAPDMGAYEYNSGPVVDYTPPYTTGHIPAKGASGIARDTNIIVHVRDNGAGVDQSSIEMTVEGATVSPAITGTPSDYTLTYDPPSDFNYEQVVNVTIDAQDLATSPNVMTQDAYSFTIRNEFNNVPELSPIGNKTVSEGTLLEFTIMATDDDGPLPLEYSADLTALPPEASFNPDTQVFSWTPTYTQAGTYPGVHFEVTDGLDIDWEDITITVNNTNRQPIANAGPDQVVAVSTQVTLDASGSSDPDGDPLDYLWTQTSGTSVTLSNQTSQTPTFTPTVVDTYVFSLVVNDGSLDSDPDSVTIAIDQWPYLPVRVNCAGDDYIAVSGHLWKADQSYSTGYWGFYGEDLTVNNDGRQISGTEDDPIYTRERYGDFGYRFDISNGIYNVTLHFNEMYRTSPGERIFDVYIEGQLVLDNLDIYDEVGGNAALIKMINNVNVTDGQLNITFTQVTENPLINGIEISDASGNQPPVAINDNYSMNKNDTLNTPSPGVLLNDYDINGDSLTAVLVSDVSNGNLTFNANGSFTYTPDTDYTGADTFTYQANDGQENSNTATVTITINSGNQAPVAVDDNYSMGENGTLNIQSPGVLSNDYDTNGDSLTAVLVGDVSNGNLTLNANGSFTYTPDTDYTGTDTFTYQANDGQVNSNTATVTITINSGNEPPVAVNDSYSLSQDTTLNVPVPGVLSNDYDTDGDSLTAVLVSDVSNGNLTLNADGSFTYNPDTGYTGTDTFTYQANDGQENSNTATVTITVNSGNEPPVLNAIGNKVATVGQTLQFTISATDLNNDSLVYSASNLPSGASFNQGNQTFSWTPGIGQEGTYNNVHFEVTDGSLTDSEDITITVTGSGGGGGGGGSGGGGGGGGSVAGITNVYYSVTNAGRFIEDVTVKSVDRRVAIDILKNTVCTNENDQPPRTITIKESTLLPPQPEEAEFIGLVYDISSTPGGALFNPPIDITFKYKDYEVPEGVAEKNLVIARYNWVTEQWQSLECTVDPENNTIMAKLNRFSTYTLLAYVRPASFEVTSISVTPQEVDLGKSVSIYILVTNTGDLTETYEVSLKLDDVVIKNEEVTLDGGDSETVSFSAKAETTGVHQVSIGDTAVSFTVNEPEAPSVFTIGEINVNPTEVNLGDIVEISVLVSNTDELAGSYEVILKIDDVAIQSEEVTIDGGDSAIVSFRVIPETIGEHTVNIGDKVAVINVKEAAPPVTEVASISGPEISHFSVTPIYDNETGELILARIDYEISKAEELGPGAKLILNVFYEGEPWEEIPLLTLSQLQSEGNIGDLGYIPSQGWDTGTYIFQVELCEADGLVQSMQLERFTLIQQSITKAVSWGSLGVIIGLTLIVVLAVVLIILYRRREMLKGYVE